MLLKEVPALRMCRFSLRAAKLDRFDVCQTAGKSEREEILLKGKKKKKKKLLKQV